ncbi:BTAD domain-containing putative transcriptional regulator [Jidongwangia harbinensis]|uniref:BTAD domain-containing putative transcriptional regulator n=1 Tax=Jidongwangia harbinensis TaxID=2878561 RepID=UPI001CDA22E6|nr:BTAD domain-containing putative transcriptional regulator [Jidongwangia harbinensis]MCA2218112.1 tetratricopeptide repeat protein [Jidongwangia harbinensis]
MRFAILGRTELIDGDTSIPLGAAKQRGLLALLLLYVGRPVRVDRLIELLWPDGGTADRRPALYPLVARLRAALDRSGVDHELARTEIGYRLDVDPRSIDLHRFRTLVDQGRAALMAGDAAAAVPDLERAVELWRGDALADLRGAPAEHLRRQLTDALIDAHTQLAGARLRIGRHHAVLLQLEDLVNEYDLDEALVRLWIGALCAAGRENAARRHLAEFRKRYRREMRADPDIELDAVRAEWNHPPDLRPRQLPYGIPGFVGRAGLLAELDRLAEPGLGRPRAVVITGMPGIGKTTLAVHWGNRHVGLFPDGQLYLDAGGFGAGDPVAPREALARFLHALGVPPDRIPENVDDRRHRVNELLAGRRVLLVIDNAAEPAQVRPLIPAVSSCLTVITSRDRLSGLTVRDGVRQLVGEPLTDDEAASLLTEIIGERRAAAEPEAVRRLTGLAAGLPLALRIIGVRVAERPRAGIAELVDELHDRLLWADAEDDSLRVVFSWSYRALTPDAARLFRRLALHPGTRISLDAATALAGSGVAETERILDVLARANLVDYDTARSYRLHDLLRQYAEAVGEAEDPLDVAAARAAVLTWFLRSATNAAAVLAPQLPPVPDLPPAPPHVMEFATEDAAFAWCRSERLNLATAARMAARHGLHRHAWQIPAAVHDLFTRAGGYEDLVQMNQLGAEEARRDGHAYGEIANLSNLGYALFGLHQYDRAIAPLTAGRARAAESGHQDAEYLCVHNHGCALLNLGDTGRAIALFHEARAAFQRLGYAFAEAATLHRLGDAYRKDGCSDLALGAYRQSLEIREKLASERAQAQSHNALSRFHLAAAEWDLAERHCSAAMTIHERIHDAPGRCDTLVIHADIVRVRDPATAVAHARTALAACTELGDSFRRAEALAVLADALDGAGRTAEAARVRAEGRTIAMELSGPDAPPLLDRLR